MSHVRGTTYLKCTQQSKILQLLADPGYHLLGSLVVNHARWGAGEPRPTYLHLPPRVPFAPLRVWMRGHVEMRGAVPGPSHLAPSVRATRVPLLSETDVQMALTNS